MQALATRAVGPSGSPACRRTSTRTWCRTLAAGSLPALQVPFCPVVRKVAGRQPQKAQYNSFHRCRNLDGAFRVEGEVPGGPVLLLDDVVGSGWTLAVVSALLRQAGSGAGVAAGAGFGKVRRLTPRGPAAA